MQLRTYTGLWNVEKRLYKFYDVSLPYPVSVKQIGIFAGTFIPWMGLMALFQVPFAPPFGHLLWLFPPAIFAFYANRPVAEGKTLTDFAASQIRFFLASKVHTALKPESNPEGSKTRLSTRTWRRLD